MNQAQMQDLGCGKYVPNRTVDWERKRDELYKPEGVWVWFRKLREEYRGRFDGDAELANKAAQSTVDTLLMKKGMGEAVVVPGEEPVEEDDDTDDFFRDKSEFGDVDRLVSGGPHVYVCGF